LVHEKEDKSPFVFIRGLWPLVVANHELIAGKRREETKGYNFGSSDGGEIASYCGGAVR